MDDMCNDNRFELIEKYKKRLIEATNIETRPDEVAVLDSILFRFWQMGWLDKLEEPDEKWTPCSEGLPEEDDDYLVTFELLWTRPIEVCTFSNGQWKKGGYEKVLAWRPLPEPYRGE